jgi:carbonic anhydrase
LGNSRNRCKLDDAQPSADAGLGELFVVRVAGNVLSPEIAGTLQYAGS